MSYTNQQQAALFYARKKRRMRAARIVVPTLTVAAGASVGTDVGTVDMTPRFGRAVYSLTDTASGRFSITADGLVEVAAAITAGTYNITIQAVDPAGNTFTTTVPVTVTP